MTPVAENHDHAKTKMGVLAMLRDTFYETAETRDRISIEPLMVANVLGVDVKYVKGAIAELMRLGMAQPIPGAASPHLAVTQGEVEITATGLAALHEHEVGFPLPQLRSDPHGS